MTKITDWKTQSEQETKMQAVLRDRQDGTFAVSFHQNDGIPAHKTDVFDSLDDALNAHPLDWQDADDDADGDVVKIASA